MTTAPPPPREEDDEPSAVSDADWAEFVKDTESRIRAQAPKEPSARARMVTERLRREDAAAAERERQARPWWRRAPKEPKKWEPEGWRTGPAWKEMRRREQRSWRRLPRTLAIVAAVAALTLVALNPSAARSLATGHGFSTHDGADADGPGIPTVDHPWAGSPAVSWADGADGIVLPKAKAVGKVTAAQVAAALRATRTYLVGTNLEPAVVLGGYPAAALRVLDPINGTPKRIKAALRSPGAHSDPVWWLSRFDPEEVLPATEVVKVRGRMTFAAGEEDSVHIHSDYTFVYALTRTGGRQGLVTRTVVRRVVDTIWFRGTPAGKIQIDMNNSDIAGGGCDFAEGYLHPGADTGVPTGPAWDPYDRGRPMPTSATYDDCGTASRV